MSSEDILSILNVFNVLNILRLLNANSPGYKPREFLLELIVNCHGRSLTKYIFQPQFSLNRGDRFFHLGFIRNPRLPH